MEYLIGRLHSFLTGGQSDFLIPLSHQWHGFDVAPLLYIAVVLCSVGAVWSLIRFIKAFIRADVRALGAFLSLMFFATAAYAASSTLGNLSAGTTITDTDLFYDVQSVGTGGVKVTGAQLKTYAGTTVNTGPSATGGSCTPGTTCTINTQDQHFSLSANAIVTGDWGGTVDISSASDLTPTIAEAGTTGFPAWWYVFVCNTGTHSQTITPGAGTIGSASTYLLASGTAAAPSCLKVTSDGVSNYKLSLVPGGSGGGNANFGTATGNTSGDVVTMANTTVGVQDSGTALSALGALSAANAWVGNETHTGTEDFSSTTTPTPAAGHVQIVGTVTAPTLGANGEFAIYTSASLGAVIQGEGSSNDVTLLTHGGTNNCSMAGNVASWTCAGTFFSANTGIGFSHSISTNATAVEAFGNTSAGTSAQEQLQFKTANATPLQASVTINGNAFSGGNGANAFTIDGVTALYLQGANTNSLSFGASGAVTIYNQPTTGTIAYAVCAAANANGSGGGALILDTSATVCGLSSMDFKRGIAAFSPSEMKRLEAVTPIEDKSHLASVPAKVDPVAEVMAMIPGEYEGDGKNITETDPQFGFFAQDICTIDNRLCIRDQKTGKPRNFRDRGVLALLVSVVQKQQAEIEELKRRVH